MISEHVVRDASVDTEASIVYLCTRGVLEHQTMVLFDIHVVDTDDRSYLSQSLGALL